MSDPIIVNLNLGGASFTFYDFVGTRSAGELRRKLEELRPFFSRIPSRHLAAVTGANFFIVRDVPRGASPGGAYYPPARISRWLGQYPRTGVEDIWLGPSYCDSSRRCHAPKHTRGLMAVKDDRFRRGVGVYQYTFLHEFAHMIDRAMGFTRNPRYGLSLHTLRGVRYGRFDRAGVYRHSEDVGEYFAEAYSRWIIDRNKICRDRRTLESGRVLPRTMPVNERQSQCSARLRGVLERL